MQKYNWLFSLLVLFASNTLLAQFAPPAGQSGTTAIYKDSSAIVAWATAATVIRGPLDIRQPNGTLATGGTVSSATGKAGDGNVLSLGDGGIATLTFAQPIRNGVGADFAVFENSFSTTFLELAFVEVSSDGINFVRFPAISNTDTTTQIGTFGAIDATQIYNLAGKYQANYGTPFDLAELAADSTLLNLEQITHVRIIDAIGCLQDSFATRDSRGVKVNDPWTTPFPSGGFDLDAIGVLHQSATINIEKIAPSYTPLAIYPNPVLSGQTIYWQQPLTQETTYQATLHSLQGQIIELPNSAVSPISLQLPTSLPTGIYVLQLKNEKEILTTKISIR